MCDPFYTRGTIFVKLSLCIPLFGDRSYMIAYRISNLTENWDTCYSGGLEIVINWSVTEGQLDCSLECSAHRPGLLNRRWIMVLFCGIVSLTVGCVILVSLISLNSCLLLLVAVAFSIIFDYSTHHYSWSLGRLY